jgi:hypothetical protein
MSHLRWILNEFAIDPQRYAIRPFLDSDYEAIARVNSTFDPQHPETAASARRWHSMIAADPRHIVALAVVEEVSTRTAIVWGVIANALENFRPDMYLVRGVLLPDHRRRGLRTELDRLLESEAIRRGRSASRSEFERAFQPVASSWRTGALSRSGTTGCHVWTRRTSISRASRTARRRCTIRESVLPPSTPRDRIGRTSIGVFTRSTDRPPKTSPCSESISPHRSKSSWLSMWSIRPSSRMRCFSLVGARSTSVRPA